VRSVQLVGLHPRLALLVVVLANGAVDKVSVEFDRDVGDDELAEASTQIARVVVGRSYDQVVPDALDGLGGSGVARVALTAMLGASTDGAGVYVGGASQVAAAFDAVTQVSEVLRVLEQQFVVVTLLRDVIDRGLTVAIGTETGMEPLADCAVVVAPYEVNGEPAGTIGVLGPTRMNYPQAIATVAVVSRRLGQSLTEG